MKKKQETAGKKRWKLTAEEKVEKRKQKLGYDPYLYEKIQPQGGIEDWMNSYPRQMFDGRSAEDLFLEEFQENPWRKAG